MPIAETAAVGLAVGVATQAAQTALPVVADVAAPVLDSAAPGAGQALKGTINFASSAAEVLPKIGG